MTQRRRYGTIVGLLSSVVLVATGCGGAASTEPQAQGSPATYQPTSAPQTSPASASSPSAGTALPAIMLQALDSEVEALRDACETNPTQTMSGNTGCVAADDTLETSIAEDQKDVSESSPLGQALAKLFTDATSVDAVAGSVPPQLYTDEQELQQIGTAALSGG